MLYISVLCTFWYFTTKMYYKNQNSLGLLGWSTEVRDANLSIIYKTLMKKIKEGTNWAVSHVHDWKISYCQDVHILFDAMDYSPPGSSVHGIFQAKIMKKIPSSPPRDLPHPGIEPVSLTSPALTTDGLCFILGVNSD